MDTKKIIIAGTAVAALFGFWGWSHYQNKDVVEKVEPEKVVQEEVQGIDAFVRSDLSESEKQDLAVILEQRKERLAQMRNILDAAYNRENGDMEKAWADVQEMREKCKERILPYIAEDKKADFNLYCYSVAEEMDSTYVQK